MKKIYEKPEIEIEVFETEEILIDSGGGNIDPNFGGVYTD